MSHDDRRFARGVAAAAILCLGILYWGRYPLLNLAAAAPLVFYLPGSAVLRGFGVKFDGWLESTVLGVALSLAIVIIAGLALNLAGSIARPGWLEALGALTLAACAFILAREAPAATAPALATGRGQALRPRHRPVHILEMAVAVVLATGAAALSYAFSLRVHEFYYTQLWIVPKHNAPDSVIIALRNAEASAENYVVELHVDHHLIQSWHDVSLKPGETWTKTFRWVGYGIYPRPEQPWKQSGKQSATDSQTPTSMTLERTALGAMPRVEALVYLSNQRSVVYRRVWTAPQCVSNEDPRGRPPCAY